MNRIDNQTMKRTAKNILVLLWSSGQSGRDFLSGFARFARHKPNWNVRLLHARDAFSVDIANAVSAGQFDGIVTDEDTISENPGLLSCPSTALVVFGTCRGNPQTHRITYVQNNDHDIGRFGARYLLALGRFRSFGFVSTNRPHQWANDRANGFAEELSKHRFEVQMFDAKKSASLANWLRELPKPTAVMAAWDNRAIEVIQTAKECGFSLPEHVAVLGVDDDELLCEFISPSLSSVKPRHDENGYVSAKALDRLLRNRRKSIQQVIVCTGKDIKERESTAPLSPAAHIILSALEFIRRNADRSIKVSDVVRHLGVSRRLADLRFKEIQNESILETITRYRLAEIEKRLLTSNLPIKKIVRNCGFSSISYLEKLFKRNYGETLHRYRQSHQPRMKLQKRS